MSKQKLESYFRKYLNSRDDIWFLKLQNSHFAATPADFIILTKDKRILVECKQVEYKDDSSSFSFERLTQENELGLFESKDYNNQAFILLMFWNKRLKNSFIYFIPFIIYCIHKELLLIDGRKSFSVKYLNVNLFKLNIVNGVLDIKL